VNAIENEVECFQRSDFLYEGQAFQFVLEAALRLIGCQFGYFHLYDQVLGEIKLTVWSKAVLPLCHSTHDNHYNIAFAGIWADSIRLRRSVIHNDYAQRLEKSTLPVGHFQLFNHMSIPVIDDGNVVAIAGFGNRESPFTETDCRIVEKFSHRCFPIMQRKIKDIIDRRKDKALELQNGDAKDLLIGMIQTLVQASALRDTYTAEHEKQVSDFAVAIGNELGLSGHELFGLQIGGLIHDIGKIAIPTDILTKTGKLLPAEYSLVKIHPELGAKIFSHLKTPWPLVEMVAQHHERLDGSGYPYGLREDQICLEARIIAVADVYDAMSTDRPYRFAPGECAALAELTAGRGTRYDAYVVDAFMSYLVRNNRKH